MSFLKSITAIAEDVISRLVIEPLTLWVLTCECFCVQKELLLSSHMSYSGEKTIH